MCEKCGQSWRAATLEGWKLWHDANLDGGTPSYYNPVCCLVTASLSVSPMVYILVNMNMLVLQSWTVKNTFNDEDILYFENVSLIFFETTRKPNICMSHPLAHQRPFS